MADLLVIGGKLPVSSTPRPNIPGWSQIVTPMSIEVAAGRILGPVEPDSSHSIHINCFGLVLKGHTPGKWKLIVDLSFPAGGSVNDGIDPGLCSLQYT